MHLVFLNQYYPPDAAPTGVMLRDLADSLVKDGHDVTVLSASGGYAQNGMAPGNPPEPVISGPRIIRIGATRFGRAGSIGKLADYLSYYLGVLWKLSIMSARPDRLVALTTPPYLSVIARLVSRFRGADHAHWVMDLYPDVLTAHGMMRSGGLRHSLLAGLARWGFGGSRSALILTLGPDMEDRTRRLMGPGPETITWVPLWGAGPDGGADDRDTALAAGLRRERAWSDDELVVMYSGNMGLGHRFGELLAAARDLSDEPVRLVFCGGGRRRQEIIEFTRANPECRIEVLDYAPADQLAAHLMSADVHVASLNPAWTGTMVPSKLQGVFAVGKPLVFIGGEDSSIGRWVRESGAGWVLPPNDVAGLIAALQEARDPELRKVKGQAAREHSLRFFNRETNIARITERLTAPR